MTILFNNPRFPDILVDFTITDPSGALHHAGAYHLANDVERRAVAERLHQCLSQGYTVTTKRRAIKEPLTQMRQKMQKAINTPRKERRA
jgi:hypothetical protein